MLDFIKVRNFCSPQTEKKFAKDICDKGLLPKIYKVTLKPQQQKNPKI